MGALSRTINFKNCISSVILLEDIQGIFMLYSIENTSVDYHNDSFPLIQERHSGRQWSQLVHIELSEIRSTVA